MEADLRDNLLVTLGMSVAAYIVTAYLIPPFSKNLKESGLKGKDLNKPEKLAKEV